eukprot:CAMPEP_0114680348 /NCGR_PEP_ID=MMETSP0191-20121206/54012_1 /TAXON_ID=126664 /ORGANISM="Sorites sp." /LENGTH=415 /DNA_ID=CAMNT_0001956989 /DNA_START=75 /DNA_END=1322 /DNA_ORIENTATION=-
MLPESLLSVANKDVWRHALDRDGQVKLFEAEEMTSWATFGAVFICLIMFDNFFLNRNPEELTIGRALRYTLFWIATAFAFCGWIWYTHGRSGAFMWMSGYMLEWLLSFDNLFVFHLIFNLYGTPDHLKHRPLYLGICGAVLFRLLFIFVGEYMMHAMLFMHFVFGTFLVYTGIKTLTADEEDEDPSQNPMVKWLQEKVPFVNVYDNNGAFFVRVPAAGEEKQEWNEPKDTEAAKLSSEEATYGTVDFASLKIGNTERRQSWEFRATMLFLVVCCLEISDLIFAVDSVSAIVAQVNDLFLAYTSAVFAMLGLRATFFIIDVLVHMFELLKYGVSAVLIFIGVKLILAHHYTIEPHIVVFVLIGCIGASMVASVLKAEMEKKMNGLAPEDVVKRVEQVKERTTPLTSPYVPAALPAQ